MLSNIKRLEDVFEFLWKIKYPKFSRHKFIFTKNTLQFILGPEWHCGTELLELLQAL